MELGTSSQHQAGRLINHYSPEHSQPPQYERLKEEYQHPLDDLSQHREQNPKDKKHLRALEVDVQAKELEKDSYKCYFISAQGARPTTYGILEKAGIEDEFNTFLRIVVPQESSYECEIAPMWPDPVGDDDDQTMEDNFLSGVKM